MIVMVFKIEKHILVVNVRLANFDFVFEFFPDCYLYAFVVDLSVLNVSITLIRGFKLDQVGQCQVQLYSALKLLCKTLQAYCR